MENPGFVHQSNLVLPNLGTTDRRKAKAKVKYIKDIDEIITAPVNRNLNPGDAEKGQIVKKDLISKRWYQLEIGLTFVNFVILLAFCAATTTAVYYIKHKFESKELEKTLLEEMPQLFQKAKPMPEEMEAIVKDLKPILEDMKTRLNESKSMNEEMMKAMNDEMKTMNEEMMKSMNEEMMKAMKDEMKTMNEEMMKVMNEEMKSMNEAMKSNIVNDSDIIPDQENANSTITSN